MAQKRFTSSSICLFLCLFALSAGAKTNSGYSSHIAFTENKGQITDQFYKPRTDIRFGINTNSGLNIFIGPDAIHYQFSETITQGTTGLSIPGVPGYLTGCTTRASYTMYRMDVELQGANKNALALPGEQQASYANYFVGGAAYKAVHSYNKITFKEVYPHIDWVLYFQGNALKHEFVVKQGGRISDIQLKYKGATKLVVAADGSLVATTPQGTITELAPKCFDANGAEIKSSYHLKDSILTYNVANYSGTLTIDPNLQWATYFGGDKEDGGTKAAVDAAGNLFVGGNTKSLTNIATTGAYQTTIAGNTDAFIAKYNSNGTLLWASYYGGEKNDFVGGLATDAMGNVFISGQTGSSTGIATAGAYQPALADTGTYPGGPPLNDGYIAKFDNNGVLQWATYFGGVSADMANSIATDALGNIFCTGLTFSQYGIATPGAYQTTFTLGLPLGAGSEAFIAKFTNAGGLLWATYYGGPDLDLGIGAATDRWGNVFISGFTKSMSGIATTGAHQATEGDGGDYNDGFLAKFSPAGNLLWGTYYGGNWFDVAVSVATDTAGNSFLAGFTTSTTNISTAGAHQDYYYPSSGYDCFLAKFDGSGTRQWGTYYGGNGMDAIGGVTTDTFGHVYITGGTGSVVNIATPGAYQDHLNVDDAPTGSFGGDAFISDFSSTGTLLWGSYYGGMSSDGGSGIAVDGAHHVYICGSTYSASGVASFNAYQPYADDSGSAFVARFNFCETPVVSAITGDSIVCTGSTISLSNSTASGEWLTVNTNANVNPAGIVTGITPGTDSVVYTVANACGNTYIFHPVMVGPYAGSITGIGSICQGAGTFLNDVIPGGTWSSAGTSIVTVTPEGFVTGLSGGIDTILYSITNACGTATALAYMEVRPLPNPGVISGSDTICIGHILELTDTVTDGEWTATNSNLSITFSGIITGATAGTDSVIYTVSNACGPASTVKVIEVINCPDGVNTLSTSVPAISIFPNPASDNITLSGNVAIRNVIIHDIAGRELLAANYDAKEVMIDLSHFSNGLYLLSVNGLYQFKIIKH